MRQFPTHVNITDWQRDKNSVDATVAVPFRHSCTGYSQAFNVSSVVYLKLNIPTANVASQPSALHSPPIQTSGGLRHGYSRKRRTRSTANHQNS